MVDKICMSVASFTFCFAHSPLPQPRHRIVLHASSSGGCAGVDTTSHPRQKATQEEESHGQKQQPVAPPAVPWFHGDINWECNGNVMWM